MFFDKLVNKLLSSDRILMSSILGNRQTHEMYITDVQKTHRKFLNLHTNGKVYGTVITGFPNINVKFSGKRKQEFKRKLESGQLFY